MEYQKIINLLDNTLNQQSKFRTRNWVEINDESRETYSISNQIKFITSMIRLNICDYSDAYLHITGTISDLNTAAIVAPANNKYTKMIFKNCAPPTKCISEINNTQVDDVHDIDLVIPMYNLIEYSDIYSKTSGNL